MIALDESARPWIRPEYEVIPLDGSAVLIRSPDQGVRASVDGVDAAELADRIRSLDGTRTMEAWRRGGPDTDGLDRLIRELIVRDVVRLDPPAFDPSDDSCELQLFAHYHPDPDGCRRRLRSSRVVVCGSGGLMTTIQRDLRAAGVGRVDLLSVPAGIDRGTVAAELRGVDLTIVCTASPRDPLAHVINDIALSERLVWLPLVLFGASAFIGPLFVPGDGPCQECVWGREQANWADPDVTRLYFDRLARDHGSLELYGSLPAFEALTSQWAVLEVTKALSRFTVPLLLGSLLRVEFLRAGTELHRVVRLPRCPGCSPTVRPAGQRPALRAVVMMRSLNVKAALGRAMPLVDERFGVVHQLVVHEIGPSDPPLFYCTARLAGTQGFSDVGAARLNGGAGGDAETAMIGALGEALERYSIALYRESDLVRGTYDALATDAVDPRRLVFYSEEQYAWPHFPYVPIEPSQTLSWIVGRSLVDGRDRLVPAARVYTPYRAPRPAELIMQSTSTGAACHVDRDRATLCALYECVERDAVTIAWLNRLALPTIAFDELADDELDDTKTRLTRKGFRPVLLDATSDFPLATVVCVLNGPSDDVPAIAVGAATHGSLRRAALKAVVESAHTWFWIHTRHLEAGVPRFREDFADITTLDRHSLLYGDPRMRPRLAFFTDEVPPRVRERKAELRAALPRIEDDPATELARCVDALARVGLDAIVVDVTPEDVRAAGFVVVRVVVPDLHPLWGGHHVRCLGGVRVRRVPVRMGYFDEEREASDFNADPHPMP